MNGRGVDRVLDMIEWFGMASEEATLSEVAAAMFMPKSSALLMLRVLVDRGYVGKHPGGRYHLIRLPGGDTLRASGDGALKAMAAPLLEEAVSNAGETGILD